MPEKLPFIIASIRDVDVIGENKEIISFADIIELRVDLFVTLQEDYLKNTFEKAVFLFNKPIIGTIRDPSEGGNRHIEDRLSYYLLIENYITYVDIELSHSDLIKTFKSKTSNSAIKTIGSYHNFESTPEIEDIEKIIDLARGIPVDIIKIATMCNSSKDLLKLFEITDRYKDNNIITISMGKAGFLSRISAWLFGSIMTYGHIGNSTAPGQLSVKELNHHISWLKKMII